MANIIVHNWFDFDTKLSNSDYWDWFLAKSLQSGAIIEGLTEKCLSSYIDVTNPLCIDRTGNLVSTDEYVYQGAVSNGVTLENIGMTGVDNGRYTFDKDTITDEEFLEIYTKSKLEIPEGDTRLKVNKVGGNNKIYEYPAKIIYNENEEPLYADLQGGFYQGFFRVGDGCDYNVLPKELDEGWSMEFVIQPKDMEGEREWKILNDNNPDGAGTFFFMGARAENKWVKYYNDKEASTDLVTSDGEPIEQSNQVEIVSDNKFLIFDRTKDGVTTETATGDEKAVIRYTKQDWKVNPFLLFNRSKDGITVNDAAEYLEETKPDYNIYKDLWKNALSFQVKEDGSVGYRYLVIDCDAEEPSKTYKILNEWSKPGNVRKDEWSVIHVRVIPGLDDSEMRLMFYVNGKLVLISKWMPMLDLRELNDLSEKQESVPFNISLGGGTQGLADVIYPDYKDLPSEVYPLEKEFAGSFIGYFKSFKFYQCSLNFTQIVENYKFEIANV